MRKFRYIAPSSLSNFITGNALEDWLNKYGLKNGFKPPVQIKRTQSKRRRIETVRSFGMQFETYVHKYLSKKYHSETVINHISDINNQHIFDKTIASMHKGTHIIYQAYLINNDNGTRGIPDFLVRSDIIDDIFEDYNYPFKTHGSAFSDSWHYVVVDAKFSTLKLSPDLTISNNDYMRYYKVQIYTYNIALARIQGYEPPYGFILGLNSINNGSITCFKAPGVIDFHGKDDFVGEALVDSITWIRRLQLDGAGWKVVPIPSNAALWANAKANVSKRWKEIHTEIVKTQNDLTILWRVTPEIRAEAHKNGIIQVTDIKTIKDIQKMGIIDRKIQETILKFVTVNSVAVVPTTTTPKLLTIDSNTAFISFKGLKKAKVDFTKNVPHISDFLYIITVCRENYCMNFLMNTMSDDSEQWCIQRFFEWCKTNHIEHIIHWGHNERLWLEHISSKYPYLDDNVQELLRKMIPLKQSFEDNMIIYRGMYDFELYNVAKSMYDLKLIPEKLEHVHCFRLIREIMSRNETLIHDTEHQKLVSHNENVCRILNYIACSIQKNDSQ